MSVNNYANNLDTAVRYALETTRAIAGCPFHPDVTIRVGDDAAESHSYARTRNIIKSDGTKWRREVLIEEIKRQLGDAADGHCPQCAHFRESNGAALKVKSALTYNCWEDRHVEC
jgi:hypothetical protein